jgi:hypothetical protein
MRSEQSKLCLECGEKIQGRPDKKFCCDQCRTSYNNRLNGASNLNYVRNVTNVLKRNRRILMELNPTGKTRVMQEKLQAVGFNFNYFTSIYTTREGAMYKFCFDQGYLEMEKNSFLLVVKKDTD